MVLGRETESMEAEAPPADVDLADATEDAPDLAPPRRPLRVTALAMGIAALSVLVLFAGWFIARVTLAWSGTLGPPLRPSSNGIGVVLFTAGVTAVSIAMAGSALGLAMGRPSGRSASYALAIVAGATGVLALGSRVGRAFAVIILPFTLLLLLPAALVNLPSSRAWVAARGARGGGGPWPVTRWMGVVATGSAMVWVLFVLLTFPLRSLVTARDGATIVYDAQVVAALGLATIAGGVILIMRVRSPRKRTWVTTAVGFGAILGALMGQAARELSIMAVVSGQTGPPPAGEAVAVVCFVAFLVAAVLLARLEDVRALAKRLAAATLLCFGVADVVAAGIVLHFAPAIQAAAIARPHYSVPGPGPAIVVLAVLAVALLRHRR